MSKRRLLSVRRVLSKKHVRILVIVVTLIVARQSYIQIEKSSDSNAYLSNSYTVVKAIDGDTIEVSMNGKAETIRFIGIDTPETHDPRKSVQCFGIAASNYTKSLVENKAVRLAVDSLSTNRDRYGRLLRYVYVGDTLVNAEIIRNGYGFANTGFPFSKMDEFTSYQREAKDKKRGLWADCTVNTLDSGQLQTNPN